MSRPLTLLLIWIGLALTALSPPCGADTSFSEEAVKAAYLHRFAAYVEWPNAAQPARAFTIGVVGSESVLAELQRLLPAINVHGRSVTARIVKSPADLEDVSILYIAPGRLAKARALIVACASRSVLVVTDDPEGLEEGGVINFIRVGSNVRFEVSQPAADRSGLKIDAALLGVAARVETR